MSFFECYFQWYIATDMLPSITLNSVKKVRVECILRCGDSVVDEWWRKSRWSMIMFIRLRENRQATHDWDGSSAKATENTETTNVMDLTVTSRVIACFRPYRGNVWAFDERHWLPLCFLAFQVWPWFFSTSWSFVVCRKLSLITSLKTEWGQWSTSSSWKWRRLSY